MEPAARLRDFFVVPPATRPATRTVPVGPAPCAILLGAPRELSTATPALALTLARARGESLAVACMWRPGDAAGTRLGSLPAVRRLAMRLAADGLDATARGRLARVTLPADAAAADAAIARVLPLARGAVTVGLAGPRDERFDEALRRADVVVVVRRPADDPALARLAVAGLEGFPAPVIDCPLRPGPLWFMASAGALVPGGLRSALRPVMRCVT